MAKLIIYEDFENEETIIEDFELVTQRILIGSGPDNELVLDAPDVQSSHASLELRDDHWVLQDLGGPGGTLANGEVIDGPFQLHHGDLIEFGIVKIRFHDEQAQEAQATAEKEPDEDAKADVQIKGRVWFAAVAGGTLAIIFFILLLLIIGDYVGLLHITDLLPPWLG